MKQLLLALTSMQSITMAESASLAMAIRTRFCFAYCLVPLNKLILLTLPASLWEVTAEGAQGKLR